MRKDLLNLLNFGHPDFSCCRDKINRVAGRRAGSNGFCYQLRQLIFDETHPAHLDGKAKTIYAATQTATNQTAGPLGVTR